MDSPSFSLVTSPTNTPAISKRQAIDLLDLTRTILTQSSNQACFDRSFDFWREFTTPQTHPCLDATCSQDLTLDWDVKDDLEVSRH